MLPLNIMEVSTKAVGFVIRIVTIRDISAVEDIRSWIDQGQIGSTH
jgi:hypothetical protein